MTAGTIVQVSSVLAWRAMPLQGAYCGAKFALRGFTEALRSELIHDRSEVHLTMVHLPAINTPQFDWARNKTGRQAKAPGPYQPEVAADAIVFAATHRRRDVFVGSSTPPTILAARLAPGADGQGAGTKGYRPARRHAGPARDGNLFGPAPGGQQAARGRFDARPTAAATSTAAARRTWSRPAVLLVGADRAVGAGDLAAGGRPGYGGTGGRASAAALTVCRRRTICLDLRRTSLTGFE